MKTRKSCFKSDCLDKNMKTHVTTQSTTKKR